MMAIVGDILKTVGTLVADWLNADAESKAAIEKRSTDGLAVMRGERKIAHDEVTARDAETKRVIEEEKRKLAEFTKP